jgi:uncharacterized protein
MNNDLLQILACPLCKGDLVFDALHQELICQFDQLAYPVIDGIPTMIEGRARRLSRDE